MSDFIFAIMAQALTFIPLAIALYVSFCVMRATDMTLDGSFVLGAAVFARLLELHVSPIIAGLSSLIAGALAGVMVSSMQYRQKINSLLAGVLATFILMSLNLIIMHRPNIGLLDKTTLLSTAFSYGQAYGYVLVAFFSSAICALTFMLMRSRFGLTLRAFGDNPHLLQRLGRPIELYRVCGFAFTNMLAAASGCLTAQTVGYADVSMGFGLTLTALGAVILGRQLLQAATKFRYFRVGSEMSACLLGVLCYFFALNGLLRMDLDPLYLKLLLGVVLVFFLRAAGKKSANEKEVV